MIKYFGDKWFGREQWVTNDDFILVLCRQIILCKV